jgi:Sigma-70, region 4/Bacterial RNA polymerase, alpha chain C terminal domain
MPLSRFPRYGVRISPTALREVLTLSLPQPFQKQASAHPLVLCDLDEHTWQKFSPEACIYLAQLLVETVRSAIPTLPMNIQRRRVPAPPKGMTLEDLDLEPRTYNCLRRLFLEGQLAAIADLGQKTIADLLNIQGFGAKCLVDLLTSLEAMQSPETQPKVAAQHGNSAPHPEEDDSLRLLYSRIRHLRLPKLPEGVALPELPLAQRTYNCLEKQGYFERPHDLEELTVEQALEIPGFGMQTLKDYLAAINRHRHGGVPYEDAQLGTDKEFLLCPWPRSCEHSFLEDELQALVSRRRPGPDSVSAERNTRIVLEYLGLDGCGGATLQEIGERYGLTRERVRQICDRATHWLKRLSSVPTLLQRTLDFVSRHLPAEAGILEAQLQRERLTRTSFRLEGLANAMELLHRTLPFEIHEIDGRRMAVHPERVRIVRRTIGIARKVIARFGVATVADVAARITELMSCTTSAEFVTGVLEGRQGFEWLEREAGWFWISSLTKNRVLSRIRKILSVAEALDVGELRSGIARHYSMNGYAPPRRVLLELCGRLSYCQIEGSFVRAKPGVDWQTALRGTELAMAKILKEHGSIMQRAKFEELCLAAGMKRGTFYAYLEYSPVIERYASGVYGLRGASVSPGRVESLIPHNERQTTVRLDHGWTKGRQIWIGYRLSEAMVRNGAFSVPSSLKKFLQGKFTLRAAGGGVMGTLSVRENSGWGLGPFYRRRGGEPGDTLLIVFDVNRQEAEISVGDEGLLEPYQPAGIGLDTESGNAVSDFGQVDTPPPMDPPRCAD